MSKQPGAVTLEAFKQLPPIQSLRGELPDDLSDVSSLKDADQAGSNSRKRKPHPLSPIARAPLVERDDEAADTVGSGGARYHRYVTRRNARALPYSTPSPSPSPHP